jgi:hypothetical protein
MPKSLQAQFSRAPRVKLVGTVLALIRLENGRQFTAKLHQLSVTGGLVHLDSPLDEGIKVEVIFHIGSHTVRNRASTLFPMWATNGCLQPFAFVDLTDENRRTLESHVEQLLDPAKPSARTQQLTENFAEEPTANPDVAAPSVESPSS